MKFNDHLLCILLLINCFKAPQLISEFTSVAVGLDHAQTFVNGFTSSSTKVATGNAKAGNPVLIVDSEASTKTGPADESKAYLSSTLSPWGNASELSQKSSLKVELTDKSFFWDSEKKTTNIFSGESVAKLSFEFKNISSNNITINQVHTSCGCTVAEVPKLPWMIAPMESGIIGVKVDMLGKSGTLSKTLEVITDKGYKTLTVEITVTLSTIPETGSEDQRKVNRQEASVDRKAVFKSSCAICHVKPGEGKKGKELFYVACGICHEGQKRASMVPNLHALSRTTDEEYWRTWIAFGRSHSLMPAFSKSEGGFLTDEQIESLVFYLTKELQ